LTASKQFRTLHGIFNTALMDISRRYKCQVFQISDVYKASVGRYSKLVENAETQKTENLISATTGPATTSSATFTISSGA